MRALVYHGPGNKSLDDMPSPSLREPGDALVRITKTTLCGTDLHILKGDVPTVTKGRILGHEGIGVIEEAGPPLHLEKLWSQNITITTRLVDAVTTTLLLKTVMSGKLPPQRLITHRFPLTDILSAYDTFGNAARERALKVIVTNQA